MTTTTTTTHDAGEAEWDAAHLMGDDDKDDDGDE